MLTPARIAATPAPVQGRMPALELLDVRGLAPTDEQRQLVTDSTDPAQLDRWFRRAVTAATADEVFAD